MKYSLLCAVFVACICFASARFRCHNNCGGKLRGYCNYDQICVCKEGYTGFDCSQRICPYDIAWADKAYDVDTAHSLSECSNQGLCNRQTGKCQCFQGFTGVACQQMTCGDCSGRGECRTLQEIYEYRQANSGISPLTTFTPWEFNHTTACVCDWGYGGSNCEYKLCPKGDDPVTAHTGYPKVLLALDYPEGTQSLGGHFLVNYLGSSIRFPPQLSHWNTSECKASFESLPNIDKVNCSLVTVTDIRRVYTIELIQLARYPYENNIYYTDGQFTNFNADPPSNPMNCDASFINGTDADLVTCSVTLVHSNRTYPEYTFCSNRGICDFETGTCACYEDFTNSDCSDYSVGFTNYTRVVATDVLGLQSTNSHFVQNLVSLDSVGEGTSQFESIVCEDSDSTIFHIDGYGNMELNYGGLSVVGTLDTGGSSVAAAGLVVTGGISIKNIGLKVSSSSDSSVDDGLVVKTSGLLLTGGGTVLSGGFFAVDGATINDQGMRVDNGVMMFAGGATVTLGGLAVTTGMTVAGGGILINKHGSTIKSGGMYINSGGLTLNGIGSGLQMPNGQTINSGGIWVTGGATVQTYGFYGGSAITGMTVKSKGFLVTDGLTVNNLGFTATEGMTVKDLGLRVTGGLTVTAGNVVLGVSGMLVSNGVTVSAAGVSIANGLSITNGGMTGAASITVTNGHFIADGSGVASTVSSGVTSGYMVITGGLTLTGGMTLQSGGMVVTNGFTISNGGLSLGARLTITTATSLTLAGGQTISSGGVKVTTKGMTVTAGGMRVAGGASIEGVRMIITGGVSVPSGGMNLFTLTITQGGLKVTNGLTVADGFLVTTGGLTITAGGMVAQNGFQSNQNVLVKLAGVTVGGAGLTVSGGITMSSGGFATADGGMLVKVSAKVTGGVTIADYGVLVTSGGVSVQIGGLKVTDLVAWDTAMVSQSGVTVGTDGVLAASGITVGSGGLVVSTGVTVTAGGLFVTTAGNTVYAGGLYVTTDGLSVTSGGVSVVGGASVTSALGLVAGVVFVQPRGSKADKLVVSDRGIHVSGGMTIASAGLNVVSGGLTLTSSGLRITGGVSVDSVGMTVTTGVTITTSGLKVDGGLSVSAGGWTTYGGMTVSTGGVKIAVGGASITDGATSGALTRVQLNGMTVSSGMSVQLDGLKVSNGMTVAIGGMTVDSGEVDVIGGLYLSNSAPLVINDGFYSTEDLTSYDPSYWQFSPTVYSDERLKRNVTSIEDALQKVAQMRGVYYRWKDESNMDDTVAMNDVPIRETEPKKGTQRHVGFIAQEIKAILPELTQLIDDEGHIGVKYDDMVAVLLEAVRALDERTRLQQMSLEAEREDAQQKEVQEEECPCQLELESQMGLLWKSIDRLRAKEALLKGLLERQNGTVA